ncbi:MAG: transglycosylase domain-containing protein [Clostridia bacterium]|nr:transglycosylase domain-containing protein [Clostridia bacterium]
MWKFIRRTIIVIVLVLLCAIGYIIYEGYSMYQNAISMVDIEEKVNNLRSLDNYTKIDDVTKMYKDAVVAIEDHRFYEHPGFDFIATVRAILANIADKEFSQGGSTISQQLAKNLYFSQEKKMTRKVAELFVVMDLEKNYSKDDILELYMNTIYYGRGYYGIHDACNGFFKKLPNELTDYEATYLAGIPNAPSIYSSEKYSELAKKRHKQVLNAMVRYGDLTQEEADRIYNE